MASDADIRDLRARLTKLHAQDGDELSAEAQARACAAAERLWQGLADQCLEKAAKARDHSNKMGWIDRARACSSEARDWAHQRRQALKLLKVDLLREVQDRLDKQERQAERFTEVVEERTRRRKLTTIRLEQAKRAAAAD